MRYLKKYITYKSCFMALFYVYFTALLIGCGGSKSGNNPQVTEPISTIPEVQTDPVAQMNALIADKDFEFTNKQQISVNVNLKNYADMLAYVSVYTNFKLLETGVYYPMPDSRVVSGYLRRGQFSQQFTDLKNQQNYLIEIWFYDLSSPLQKELSVTNSELIW